MKNNALALAGSIPAGESRAVLKETRNLWGIYRSTGLKGLQKIPGIGQRIAWDIIKQIQPLDKIKH